MAGVAQSLEVGLGIQTTEVQRHPMVYLSGRSLPARLTYGMLGQEALIALNRSSSSNPLSHECARASRSDH